MRQVGVLGQLLLLCYLCRRFDSPLGWIAQRPDTSPPPSHSWFHSYLDRYVNLPSPPAKPMPKVSGFSKHIKHSKNKAMAMVNTYDSSSSINQKIYYFRTECYAYIPPAPAPDAICDLSSIDIIAVCTFDILVIGHCRSSAKYYLYVLSYFEANPIQLMNSIVHACTFSGFMSVLTSEG